jgi:lipoate-protein ligase A
LATDELLRRRLAATPADHGVVRVYTLAGDVVSAGRHHIIPAGLSPAQFSRLHRRHSGGRNVPFGDGFVGVSIVLPHRSALVSDDPSALAPHQVLNRCVRGILEGFKSAGIPAFYPGRDWVTVDGRIIGMVSFEVGCDGGLVFEAVIAASRDFTHNVDALDGSRMPKLSGDDVTSIRQQLGVGLELSEIAEVVTRGYARHFDLSFETAAAFGPQPEEIAGLACDRFERGRWLAPRIPAPGLRHRASAAIMLGILEAWVAPAPGSRLGTVLLGGDIIANSGGIETLQARLKGCPADRASIAAVVAEVLAMPDHFFLGVPDAGVIAATIMQALQPGDGLK